MNWRTPITLVVLLGVLLGAAYYGWQTIVDPGGGDDDKASKPGKHHPSCGKTVTIKKGQQVHAADVVVNVYNAGERSGLAGETLDELVDKGFKRGVSDNAPERLAAGPNVTVVLPRGEGAPQTRLVHNQFVGVVKYLKGPQLAPGVDVIVGNNFRGVDRTARTFVRVNRVVKTCTATKKGNG